MVNNKIVLCVELNKQFPSIRNAAHLLNIDASGISKVIRGKQKTAGGYTWVNLNPDTHTKVDPVIDKKPNKLSQSEIDYWIDEFIKDSKLISSLEEFDISLKNLYKSLKKG